MKSKLYKKFVSILTVIAFGSSIVATFPVSEVVAEVDKYQNEMLYSAVLNEYVENVIPGNIALGWDTSREWNYSDVWMYSTGNLSDYGYQFFDLDEDGIEELFILDFSIPSYGTRVNEIYTLVNGSPKQIATGGARWDYYVVNAENVLGESGSGGATVHGYTYYHLKNGVLVAFENYINDNGIWYYASGDGCTGVPENEMQILSENEVYSQHPDTIGGIEALIFDEGAYRFSSYNPATPNSDFVDESINYKCGDDAYWQLDDSTGTLTIKGTGAIYDYGIIGYDENIAPWFFKEYDENSYLKYECNVKNLIIEEGITSIGECAFCEATSLESVLLPDSLTEIKSLAFQSCPAMKRITIPIGVNYIGDYALGYEGNGIMKVENFTIYGYQMSAAYLYAGENDIVFVALDDYEDIPETTLSETEQKNFDFINHHVGVAELNGSDRNVWALPDDIGTLVELIKFDYYYGNTGVGFATEAYANLGNAKEIVVAGREAKDIYSSVSEVMYYQALLCLLFDYDDDSLFDITKSYYIDTLEEISNFANIVDVSYSITTDIIPKVSDMISEISGAQTYADLGKALERGDDSLKLFDLKLNDYNLDVGAGDVISIVSAFIEISSDTIEKESDLLNAVVYFRMFRDLQTEYKSLLNQMYEFVPENNSTYKTALKNINNCLTTPDVNSFYLNYVVSSKVSIGADFWDSVLSVGYTTTITKLFELVPGGKVLAAMDIAGQLIDEWFDNMTLTEEKIASIGEVVCYLQIADTIEDVGEKYSDELLKIKSLQNASAYHNTVCLYYKAIYNCCKYGNIFLNQFIGSYYSIDFGNRNNHNFIDNVNSILKDNLVFKYVSTTLENNLADDYLNNVFGISNGDYLSWYRETVVLAASINELTEFYRTHQEICCRIKSTEETEQCILNLMQSTLERSEAFIKSKASKWFTTFIGCPVSTDIMDEGGVLIATISNGKIHIKNRELYSNIIVYSLSEDDDTYGTLILSPDNYIITTTAQDNCEVIIQQSSDTNMDGIKLLSEEWLTQNNKLQRGEVIEIHNELPLTKNTDSIKYIIILTAVICVAVVAILFYTITRKKHRR